MGNDNSKETQKQKQQPKVKQQPPPSKQIKSQSPAQKQAENQKKKVKYVRTKMLGYGTSGKVYQCIDVDTKKTYAMKIIELSAKTKQEAIREITNLKREIGLLKKLSHPNIVGYYNFDVDEQNKRVEIVLQKVTPGNLKDIVKEKPFKQSQASKMGKQILEGLKYLHKEGIIHRDLKGANILVNEKNIAKIADFGTAKHIVGVDIKTRQNIAVTCKSLKGTPYWMAPEVLKRVGHQFSADIWSFGCTIIQMLTGAPPWSLVSQNFEQIIRFITTGMQPPFPDKISRDCQHFLNCCLDPNPKNRLTAPQLLNHKWIKQFNKQLFKKQVTVQDIDNTEIYNTIQKEYTFVHRESIKDYKPIKIYQTPKLKKSQVNPNSNNKILSTRPFTSASDNIIIESSYAKMQREQQQKDRKNKQKMKQQSRRKWQAELKAAFETK